MRTSDFDYELPEDLIAQERIKPFHNSKLMVLDKDNKTIEDKKFYNIVDYLSVNDVLVFNNTKVFKARLFGEKESGSKIEILLLEPIADSKHEYLCLTRGKVKKGTVVCFSNGFNLIVKELLENGDRIAEFSETENLKEKIEEIASMPLPEYIKSDERKQKEYQTVYASDIQEKSIAAPTAGFHFTNELLEEIKKKGVSIEYISLNVGVGTFRPVKSDIVEEHIMHYESYHIDKEVIKRLNDYKKDGKRIIAVGTTSIRTLEDSANEFGILEKEENNTNLFITPGYKFKFIDSIITNFHLPKSTLIMLVSAFATKDFVMDAYKKAVERKYKFFSFGDAMFIK